MLAMAPVSVGLVLGTIGYCILPPGLWRPLRPLSSRAATALLISGVLVSGVLLLIPKPTIDDALVEPHPALWVLFGHRPHQMESGTAEAAELPEVSVGRPRYTVKQRPTNVLIVLLESTSARSTAIYNRLSPAGRELLRYQNETVVFDNLYSPVPTSAHALFSILYGLYPYIGPFWTRGDAQVVAESMPQVLGRAGDLHQLIHNRRSQLRRHAQLRRARI